MKVSCTRRGGLRRPSLGKCPGPLRDGVNLLSSKYSLVSCSAFKRTIFFNMKSLMDTGTSQTSVKFSL
ncbi:unnamed protein product [Gulo gulo]|uniref:Uncharacterized protein n=1 Tax=Gulo gulo TaxID=48420 RepID=A0A9X9LMS8_GULGU|nr:unnamed protein product [Gulo gulo]